MNNNSLSTNFTQELISSCLERKNIFDIVRKYLKVQFLQTESQKKIFMYLVERYDKTGNIPTYGQLQQNFIEDEKTLQEILEIREIEIDEKDTEHIIESFENFIKKMKFLEANDKIADLYNQDKKELAYSTFVKYAEEFSKFSIRDASFETVFSDFHTRQAKRKNTDWKQRYKIPTGIDELDYRLGGENGGPETGECVLWLGDSGTGKSQAMVSVGIYAVRQGFRVAHFQLEGTKEQCLNRYDAAWTGTLYQDMKIGNIPEKNMKVTEKIVKKLKKTDIIVSSEESFNQKTVADIRFELKEMTKKFGKIDVILIDYLELLETGDGHNYAPKEERFRQTKIAKGLKMLAMEFNAVVHSPTQSNSIPEEMRNDPDFVLTRVNLSEDRGKLRPFDIVITMNQTRDEYSDEVMRLHTEKLRDYKADKPFRICNNFARSRFYDRKRTLEIDWETYENREED